MTDDEQAGMEAERQDILRLAYQSYGSESEVHRLFDPGTFGAHEATDRLDIVNGNLWEYVLSHPAVAMNPEAFRRVYEAHYLLADAYQKIGGAEFVELANQSHR